MQIETGAILDVNTKTPMLVQDGLTSYNGNSVTTTRIFHKGNIKVVVETTTITTIDPILHDKE